jgi:rhamnosyltransferase
MPWTETKAPLRAWAIVVTYCPGASIFSTIDALIGQVDHIHIVDNGSDTESLIHLGKLICDDVSVEFLGKNTGIGYALNVGVRNAHSAGATWVLTLDQDSTVGSKMVAEFLRNIAADSQLGCLCPVIVNHGQVGASCDEYIDFAITSGNFVRIDWILEVGGFNESFFIDGVDIDFSLRLREKGRKIKRVSTAFIYHKLGDFVDCRGLLSRFYARHSVVRRYYMARNHVFLIKRHSRRFPIFILRATLVQILSLVAIVKYEGFDKGNFKMILFGLRDGIRDFGGVYRESRV